MNWDLTLIYKTNEEYLNDYNSLDEDVLKIENLKGKLNTEEALVEYTRVNKEFSMKLSKIFTYVMLAYDLNQKDKIAILQDKFDDIKMFVSKIIVKNKLVPKGYKDEIIEIPIISKVNKDATVYKIVDNDLVEEINQTYLKNSKKVPIRMKFISNVNEPMALILQLYTKFRFLQKHLCQL